MIVKELDGLSSEDKFAKAGRVAEEQMVYYLRRAFKEDKNVCVFNDLRLEQEQDAAQIDHLILHRYGITIVESKSVTTRIQVNEYGEWSRWFNGTLKGMPSPVLQAQRQGEFLRKYLNAHAEILLGKILGFRQATFRNMPLDILVAISDSGIINRPKQVLLEEVCKADQVTERIQAKFEKSRKVNNLFNFDLSDLKEPLYSFTENELSEIIKFLLKHHKHTKLKPEQKTSLHNQVVEPTPRKTKLVQPAGKMICRHCQSNKLSVEYGKYGYYLKCLECNGNTPINAICKTCGNKEKIRKSGRQFYAECERCGTSTLFHANSALN
jgi:hypothetical protein